MIGDPEFSIYPRGFLGDFNGERPEQLIERPDPLFRSIQNTHRWADSPAPKVTSNKAVEELYGTYMKNAGDTSSREFRKKILKAALHAFGTMQFDHWYAKQFVSPSVGDTHHRFLDDTLLYIKTGRREMCLENWAALLSYNENAETNGLSEAGADFFGISTMSTYRNRQNGNLIDIIAMWTSQSNGIEDLLGSLHILFGKI